MKIPATPLTLTSTMRLLCTLPSLVLLLAGSPQPNITTAGLSGTAPLLNTTADTTAEITADSTALVVWSALTHWSPTAGVYLPLPEFCLPPPPRRPPCGGPVLCSPPQQPPPPPPPPTPPPPLRLHRFPSLDEIAESLFRIDELVRLWGTPGAWFAAVLCGDAAMGVYGSALGLRGLVRGPSVELGLLAFGVFSLGAPSLAWECVAGMVVAWMTVTVCVNGSIWGRGLLLLLLCCLPGVAAVEVATRTALAAASVPGAAGMVAGAITADSKRKRAAAAAPGKKKNPGKKAKKSPGKKAKKSPKPKGTKDLSPGHRMAQQLR